MKLKRKALLALGLLAAEAVHNSKVREALDKLAEKGVTKAAKLMEKASEWLREHGKKQERAAGGSVRSGVSSAAKPRSARKRRKAALTGKPTKRTATPRKKKS